MPLVFGIDQKGILPDHMIVALARSARSRPPTTSRPTRSSRRASTCGSARWPIACARASCRVRDTTVAERIDDLKLHEIALADGAVLETGCVYIVPLLESLALPREIAAAANPKSSTGRLDVFTRVIADETRGFDHIKAGYHGPLYAEISPRTFPVLVREGSRLSQIRFRHGNALLDAEALRALHARERLVDDDDADVGEGMAVSVDLSPAVAARARRASSDIAPSAIPVSSMSSAARGYDVADFWEPIRAARTSLILDPDEFYILASKEAVQVPPDYAAEMVPFDPLVGEFRVHYAGFFDPGFGYAGAAGAARAPCSKCARARCRSSSSTARSSAGWSTSRCWTGRSRSTARASARTTRRRASSCRSTSARDADARRQRRYQAADCICGSGANPCASANAHCCA